MSQNGRKCCQAILIWFFILLKLHHFKKFSFSMQFSLIKLKILHCFLSSGSDQIEGEIKKVKMGPNFMKIALFLQRDQKDSELWTFWRKRPSNSKGCQDQIFIPNFFQFSIKRRHLGLVKAPTNEGLFPSCVCDPCVKFGEEIPRFLGQGNGLRLY